MPATPDLSVPDVARRWSLQGRRALVTGGTKGIGRAVAEELLGLGASVCISARTAADVDAAVAAWRAAGLNAHGLAADVSRPGEAERLVAATAEALGGLDVLVNNVGTNLRKAFVDYHDDEIDAVLNTNLRSAFALCRHAHPHLRRSGTGAVVNVSSVAGVTAIRTGVPYGASKAAMIQFTRNLALEWAPDGIRVNAVAPWYIQTPLAADVLAREDYRAGVLARTPLGRIGEPHEVGAAVAFLCLPAASYITGHCLAVDGGMLSFGF